MRKPIVLIACAKKKLSHRASVKELYISTLFKLNLEYAKRLTTPNKIFVLSAKYGLLELERKIEPYEKTLRGAVEIKAWAECVLNQMKAALPTSPSKVIFLAGDRYRKYLLPHIENPEVPLKGYRMGEQIKELQRRLKG